MTAAEGLRTDFVMGGPEMKKPPGGGLLLCFVASYAQALNDCEALLYRVTVGDEISAGINAMI